MSSEGKSRRIPEAKSPKQRGPAKTVARPRHHRGGMFSMDSEQSARMLLFGITAAVLIAAAAFIAIGYYVSVIQPRNRTVLKVDSYEISYSAMKRRMAFEYASNPALQNPQSIFSIPQIAYQNLTDELTLLSLAEPEFGITITAEEFDERLRSRIGVAATADAATFSDTYRNVLSASRLKKDEYELQVRADVLGDKVGDKLVEARPAAIPQARIEVIGVSEDETAQCAIDRINAGEAFADVAKELSLDSDATNGGVKDFNFDLAMQAAYREFSFSAPVGELSAPLQDPSGQGALFVVRVIAREDQPVREDQETVWKSETYRTWLTDAKTRVTIVDDWSDDREAQADAALPLLKDAQEVARRAAEEQQRPQPTIVVPTAAASVELTPAEGTPATGSPVAETPTASPPAVETPAASPPANGQ
jgi:parvulin-like peptidyl-prolyl isomerase